MDVSRTYTFYSGTSTQTLIVCLPRLARRITSLSLSSRTFVLVPLLPSSLFVSDRMFRTHGTLLSPSYPTPAPFSNPYLFTGCTESFKSSSILISVYVFSKPKRDTTDCWNLTGLEVEHQSSEGLLIRTVLLTLVLQKGSKVHKSPYDSPSFFCILIEFYSILCLIYFRNSFLFDYFHK